MRRATTGELDQKIDDLQHAGEILRRRERATEVNNGDGWGHAKTGLCNHKAPRIRTPIDA